MKTLPTFKQLAEYELNRITPKQKTITIKIEILTAKTMMENENKLLNQGEHHDYTTT